MYGGFTLLDDAGAVQKGHRIYLGEEKGKDEAWLRDMLFEHPDIIPVEQIDPSFGPLMPLCKELRTDAGPIDAVFINPAGRITLVECKLWKNPQARREVVAQALDYVSAMGSWTYADLQRQTSAALGRKGNLPFEAVSSTAKPALREEHFADSVSRSLRDGRILALLVGDGIREGVRSLTELINRNASRGFALAIIEVALYRFSKTRLAIQPRVLAETDKLVRHSAPAYSPVSGSNTAWKSPQPEERPSALSGGKQHLRTWWEPVLAMSLDDPEQERPTWSITNNVILNTSFPGIQIKAFAMIDSPRVGVFLSAPRRSNLTMLQKYLRNERAVLLSSLPSGTKITSTSVHLVDETLQSDDERREWPAEKEQSCGSDQGGRIIRVPVKPQEPRLRW